MMNDVNDLLKSTNYRLYLFATEDTEVTEKLQDIRCFIFLGVLGERSAELTSKPLLRKEFNVLGRYHNKS